MAIYKPTDCSPFNGTFDLSADLPIVFECKIDTSNSPVTGYSIEIYNSNNEIIFPGVNRTLGPIKSNVTYLTDLKEYVKNKLPSLLSNIRNVNSGLSGTILEIPAIVNSSDLSNTTVGRNQVGFVSGGANILVDGQTYTWKITLYQEIKKGNNVSATTDDSIFPPNAEKYYDMTVTSGTVIGSNEKRIQTALIDSDDRVVDNLVLPDKFIQPIKIDGLSEYDPSDPVAKWSGDVPKEFSMTRSLVTGYDSTYGYVYPSTAEGNAFADGQIVPENANGFQIFKNGNNPANLTATDMVEFVYDGVVFKGNMTWKPSAAKPEQSYWEQVYTVDSDPAGVFYPLTGDGYSTFALTGSERIIFNNIQDSEVLRNEIYYGSPYNGIFEPHFSSKKIDGETSTYQVTVVWNRTSDAANWGTLSNKIIYCRRDGKNYEINTTTQVGEINKTPFKFVEEKPVRIFNTATVETQNQITGDDSESNPRIFHTSKAISSILSVTNNNGVDVTKDCAFEVGKNYIIYTSSSAIPSDLTISVKYIPFNIQDYTGIIFYNKRTTPDLDTGIVYIRPSININKNMIFKEVTTSPKPTWFNINYFNKDYNYITYTGNNGFDPEVDRTRYQIKSFYKDSDYNPFSIYRDPNITSYLIVNGVQRGDPMSVDGLTNSIGVRNFSVISNYEQDNYIQWKSYQWFLYDSAKRTILKKTDEQYSGQISATFYGLDPQKYYILSLVLQTNVGKIIEINYVLYVEFEETPEQKDLVEAEFDCDTLAMKANLKPVNTILAPNADEYLSNSANPTKDTAYYYDENNFYKKKDDSESYKTVASIDGSTGILKIVGQNLLEYNRSFEKYDINSETRVGSIQTDADEIVIEGVFTFSDKYNGNIFSISKDDESKSIMNISIPAALQSVDSDGFVDITKDINKIKIKDGSYLKIIGNTEKLCDEWQDPATFYNTSVWKKVDQDPSGNRINIANFKYAEVDVINKDNLPYPYEKGKMLMTATGASINWNQIFDKSQFSTTKSEYGINFTNNGDGTWTVVGKKNIEQGDNFYLTTVRLISGHKYFLTAGLSSDKKYKIELLQSSTQYDAWGEGAIFACAVPGEFKAYMDIYEKDVDVVFKPQLFDLTQMFGAGSEPIKPEDFWLYFDKNKVYAKDTYINITGAYNSYNNSEPIKNPMAPTGILVDFETSNNEQLLCKEKTSDSTEAIPFQLDQPDRLIWLDYTPTKKQQYVVIDANESGPKETKMTVMEDNVLCWPSGDAESKTKWKDGIYVESGCEKALIGRILVNGDVYNSAYLPNKNPEYSNSGLTQQIQIPQKINERKEIINYKFSFRIFVNTNNFSVDQLRSRCYVKRIS